MSLGTFNGSSTTITWQLTDAVLPIPYGTGKTIDTFKKVAAGCLGNMVKQAVKAEPAAGGTDVMAALDAAGEQIGSTSPGNSQVMIITDGLSNTGCLNLNQVFSVGESAASVVRTCPGQGGIARLRGVSLELAGIGVQAQSKPLPSSDQTWLVRYWRDVCTALGVKQAQSCVSTEGDAGVRASDLNRPLDPPISFPGISRPGQDILPADLLFAFDSATLTPTAQAYLDILVPQIRSRGLSRDQDRRTYRSGRLGRLQPRALAAPGASRPGLPVRAGPHREPGPGGRFLATRLPLVRTAQRGVPGQGPARRHLPGGTHMTGYPDDDDVVEGQIVDDGPADQRFHPGPEPLLNRDDIPGSLPPRLQL